MRRPPRGTWARLLLTTAALLWTRAAQADTDSFELGGKIYTKWLYQNDGSQGCTSMSNPFWQDNIGGGNGVCSEFELNIKGRVSKYVTAGVRLKSRFGAMWHDWWENGDARWDFPNNKVFFENTSGESLGQNHAAYMKLRGAWVRAALPIPTVRWLHVGSTDFGMFNEWTIGKSRYTDRDNGSGVFIEGEVEGVFSYTLGAIALPKLYVGPRWNTGLSGADPLAGFWGQDWAYAAKIGAAPIDGLQLSLIGAYVQDWEIDRNDPDLTGARSVDRGADHAASWESRFQSFNGSLEVKYAPPMLDFLNVTGLVAFSSNKANPEYATNAVRYDQGFSPILYLEDADGEAVAARDFGGTLRVELFDPLENGLSLKAEYFNIGTDFNAIFGARREADVLLTDGFLGSGFYRAGQLPTLNLANEFVDFDEPWYENIIGWHGATGLLEYDQGGLKVAAEYSYLTYNTNMQGRDVDSQYPDFLYTDGFTDVQAWTADRDYPNAYDRGRDPRSVYKEYQDRSSQIIMVDGEYMLPFADWLTVRGKGKLILDRDDRKADNPDDDYKGDLYLGFIGFSARVNNELKVGTGYEYQYWKEDKRSGSQQQGFFDYKTKKHTWRGTLSYNFGGLSASYLIEYFHKDQDRDRPGTFNQRWNVWRSKATLEVAW